MLRYFIYIVYFTDSVMIYIRFVALYLKHLHFRRTFLTGNPNHLQRDRTKTCCYSAVFKSS